MRVAVVGASPNPERYSNKAVRLLSEYGHAVVPVTPAHEQIEQTPAVKSLDDLPIGSIDTVTLYVQASRSDALQDALVQLKPRRVIFNPGAEDPPLAAALASHGISTEEACTLVLLRTGGF